VSVVAFDDLTEGERIANDTAYALDATIWTCDVSAAHTLARQVHAGAVWINGWGGIDPALPWGGTRTSGVGRELRWSGIFADLVNAPAGF
jgi:betaine-aldehyde dehydrogenase